MERIFVKRVASHSFYDEHGDLVIGVCAICATHQKADVMVGKICTRCADWIEKMNAPAKSGSFNWAGVYGEYPCPPEDDPIWQKHIK